MKKVVPKVCGSLFRSDLRLRLKITAWITLVLVLVTTALICISRAKAAPQQALASPATANQPALPSYFSGLKDPDPTGSNYGVWATPSGTPNADGSPSGDIPSKLSIADLYDRVLHNQML